MFKRIVVPLDGSPLAEAILPSATRLAAAVGAQVDLLRVAQAPAMATMSASYLADEEVRVTQEAEAYLAALQARLASDGAKVQTVVRYGHAATEIVDHVRSHGAGLVAMSTHGRSGLGRLVMGSVAEEVVRKVAVPVLLLRAQAKH
jgi:nucleotide-binding universal stress UspA family protein